MCTKGTVSQAGLAGARPLHHWILGIDSCYPDRYPEPKNPQFPAKNWALTLKRVMALRIGIYLILDEGLPA